MQSHDWNDLKHFLALFRTRKLRDAAAQVGTSESTVARRIKVLEDRIGGALFRQSGIGRYEPTDVALQVHGHAEAVERENAALREQLGRMTDTVTGSVRVSAVPILVNRFLVPNAHRLARTCPHLTLELVPASHNLDLSKREADIAVRFARPREGGLSIRAQKLGQLAFAAYGPASDSGQDTTAAGWIRYDETHANLPQAAWLEAVCNKPAETAAPLKVADAETALEAAASGLGKTLLPRIIADADPRLHRQAVRRGTIDLPVRDVWLLSHADQSNRLSVAAVKDWLTSLPWKTGQAHPARTAGV